MVDMLLSTGMSGLSTHAHYHGPHSRRDMSCGSSLCSTWDDNAQSWSCLSISYVHARQEPDYVDLSSEYTIRGNAVLLDKRNIIQRHLSLDRHAVKLLPSLSLFLLRSTNHRHLARSCLDSVNGARDEVCKWLFRMKRREAACVCSRFQVELVVRVEPPT